MHNTDRGADNYMIKYCEGEHEKPLVDVAPSRSDSLQMPMMGEVRKEVETFEKYATSSLKSLEISLTTGCNELHKIEQDIHKAVQDRFKQLEHDLKFSVQHKQKAFTKQQQQASKDLLRIDTVTSESRAFFSSSTHKFLNAKGDFLSRVQSASQHSLNTLDISSELSYHTTNLSCIKISTFFLKTKITNF